MLDRIGKGARGTIKGSNFVNQQSLDSHYQKYQCEYGNITKEQYLKTAQELVNSTPGRNILSKACLNGDIFVLH